MVNFPFNGGLPLWLILPPQSPFLSTKTSPAINSLVSSKASTATSSCVDGDLPVVSSLSPLHVYVFCPGSYQ